MMYGLEMVAPRKRQESGLELVMELKMLTMLRGGLGMSRGGDSGSIGNMLNIKLPNRRKRERLQKRSGNVVKEEMQRDKERCRQMMYCGDPKWEQPKQNGIDTLI